MSTKNAKKSKDVTISDLEATLSAMLKTVEWLKEQIRQKRSKEFLGKDGKL